MRVVERVARALITVGGIGTIVAVTLIVVFLVWVATPLFRGADVRTSDVVSLPSAPESFVAVGIDEYQAIAWGMSADGSVSVWRYDTGQVIQRVQPFGAETPTSVSLPSDDGRLAVGFGDGSARLVRFVFSSTFEEAGRHVEALARLDARGRTVEDVSVVERTPEGQLRIQTLAIEVGERLDVGARSAIRCLDATTARGVTRVVACDDAGHLHLADVERSENAFTGEITASTNVRALESPARADGSLPWRVLASGVGDRLLVVWRDGLTRRFDARTFDRVVFAEEFDLAEGAAEVTALSFVIGRSTIVVGDSSGRVRAWFGIKPEGNANVDGVSYAMAHELYEDHAGAHATSVAASMRTRAIVAGFSDGFVRIFQVTSEKELFAQRLDPPEAVGTVAFAPKDDGFAAWTGARLARWSADLGHPEATLSSLFGKVWYEGYPEPTHAWQSTSGSDHFEPKLGFAPLVFGTLKAAFYSMLFGVPLALLAAIYTSEFLDKRLKVPLKSIVELMASLPSVVLGFVAALVLAPIVRDVLPAVLASFFTIPLALLCGAYLWQLLPQHLSVRWSGVQRFGAMFASLPVGVLLAVWIGPAIERQFFAGDVKGWLDGGAGDSVGGWILLLLPLSALAFAIFSARVLGPYVRRISAGWNREKSARFEVVRFALAILAVFGVTWLGAKALDGAGFDSRGGVLGNYGSRNTLIVGFIMGFAIIPIIYTLAEDALSSVPGHLRLASLGAGATPWQTAVRVVIPTAMSGLFSAVMIGLGRAVGETMIVLMATGGTAVLSWNVFQGLRSLSANIAIELPEAVKNSTHYRTLFLAGLCLFAMTFVANTVAEIVRQRFRKRAFQL